MTYLAAAMIGVWLLVTLYLVYVGQRQRALEEELRLLEERLAEGRRNAPSA
jgi:CcmD family protein